MSDGLAVAAHAKVNLGLAVLARRGDGYHEVETWLARIDLHDSVLVTVDAAAGGGVSLTVVGGGTADGVPGGAANLAARAAEAYLRLRSEATGAKTGGVSITLSKHVPVAAGLGGGSSDAGAVLRALAQLLPLPGPPDWLARLAASIGSDVPFFAADLSSALARGRGERLSPAPAVEAHLVLANPGVAVSAAEAYAALVGFSPRLKVEKLAQELAGSGEPRWHNALQPGVQRAYPVVRRVVETLKAAGLRSVIMSGSGPTCFGVARSAAEADAIAARVAAEEPDWWVRSAVTG